jgi:hypothetical protein
MVTSALGRYPGHAFRPRQQLMTRSGRLVLDQSAVARGCHRRLQIATLEPEYDGHDGGHRHERQTEIAGDPLRLLAVACQRREDRLHPQIVARVQEDRRPEAVGLRTEPGLAKLIATATNVKVSSQNHGGRPALR